MGESDIFWARMNGHKSAFRLYAAGEMNKMDNKLLDDHLIYYYIDYFQMWITIINNNEHQLEELLS